MRSREHAEFATSSDRNDCGGRVARTLGLPIQVVNEWVGGIVRATSLAVPREVGGRILLAVVGRGKVEGDVPGGFPPGIVWHRDHAP